MEEHGIILKAIDVLEQSSTKELPTDFYIKLLDTIKNFADRCHHGKEETCPISTDKAKGRELI